MVGENSFRLVATFFGQMLGHAGAHPELEAHPIAVGEGYGHAVRRIAEAESENLETKIQP